MGRKIGVHSVAPEGESKFRTKITRCSRGYRHTHTHTHRCTHSNTHQTQDNKQGWLIEQSSRADTVRDTETNWSDVTLLNASVGERKNKNKNFPLTNLDASSTILIFFRQLLPHSAWQTAQEKYCAQNSKIPLTFPLHQKVFYAKTCCWLTWRKKEGWEESLGEPNEITE